MSKTVSRETLRSVAIRFAGDSGDGMQLTGDRFTQEAAHHGNLLATSPDFPAEIRAPAGSLAGVSSFQICLGSEDVFTPGDIADVLVAMNPAALKKNISELRPGGILITNSENFESRNLKLAGYESNPLEDEKLLARVRAIPIPIHSLTSEALRDSGLAPAAVKRCGNFFALGVVCWLFGRNPDETLSWIESKFSKKPEVAAANKLALRAGQVFAEATDLMTAAYEVPAAHFSSGTYRNITGHHATVCGLVAAAELSGRPLFYAGYPITPASDVLQELAALKRYGVSMFQAEDEIAACCAAIGASYAGSLAVTATSGPGMTIKQESIGLAVMTELPLVVVNVQRAGPSTGLPTKPEQADLLQAMYGRNGECPLVILAISSPADAFETTIEACRIALEHMTPVVLLSDASIAFGSQPWKLPDVNKLVPIKPRILSTNDGNFRAYARDENTLARSWALPGSAGLEHRIGGLEKDYVTGAVSYEGPNHERMVTVRAEKVLRVGNDFAPLTFSGDDSGELLVLGWGSSWGAIQGAVRAARHDGIAVSHLHLRHLNPLHPKLGEALKRFRKVLIPEMNSGHLRMLIRNKFLIDAIGLNKVQGQAFKISEVLDGIRNHSSSRRSQTEAFS